MSDTLFPELMTQRGFTDVTQAVSTDFACPKCGHEWSGNPKAGAKRQQGLAMGVTLASGTSKSLVARVEKPPYRVPTMAEVAGIPWNGMNVVSTFSGCGGSCLGFKLAGFRVLWANEFVPEAAKTYRANHPGTILSTEDIRKVQPGDVLAAIDLKEIDVLEGSPPCAAFSSAGKRQEGWGQVRKYSDVKQRVDDLFWEFARILKGLQPKVFVAENVAGLARGVSKGYFLEIREALEACGYRVRSKILDASLLGVPQSRNRLIFVGVRSDLAAQPAFPEPLSYVYTIRDVLPCLQELTFVPHGPNSFDVPTAPLDRPAPAVLANAEGGTWARHQVRVVHDTKDLHSAGDVTDKPAPAVTTTPFFYVEREADISAYAIGREWDKLHPGEKSEKYLNLVKPKADEPCPTITAAGVASSIASVTHPTERRKFSIEELKLICSFPSDFILTGTYQQQWERLGRAVPPLMMMAIAETIRDKVLCAAS